MLSTEISFKLIAFTICGVLLGGMIPVVIFFAEIITTSNQSWPRALFAFIDSQLVQYFTFIAGSVITILCGALGYYLNVLDVSSKLHLTSQRKLRDLVYKDPLTGLYNRAYAREHLSYLLETLPENQSILLMLLDLDDFKLINDTHGHVAGDQILKKIAERFGSLTDRSTFLFRLGGDEFVIIRQLDAIQTRISSETATRLAEQVRQLFRLQFQVHGTTLHSNVSMGAVICSDSSIPEEDLFRQVDIALYESKKFSGTHFQLFDKQMEVQLFDRISLDKDMENGLERGEFVVYFQPQAYTKRMSVFGFEALVRWKRKGAGIVPPDQFISAAETSGFIQKLDLYVLQKACETAVGWAYDFKVSVNLSPLLFSNVNLPANIQNIIKSTGIDPSRLTLEITETALMSNREQTIVALNKLRELGLKIALDDFGTGYSSLSYLYEFPLDILKIDRAFVADLTENPTKQAIFKSIVELGQKLNLFVIVEGIETEEQRLEAARLGADSIQGYLLSKPFPNEQMTEKLVELMRNTTRTATGSNDAKPENTEARATG